MPALPWLAVETPDPEADLIVMASRLPLRSHGDIPRFLRHTWLIRRQLTRSPGLVGYSLDAHPLAKTFWTVSAWQGLPDMGSFDRASPHAEAKGVLRSAMMPSKLAMRRYRPEDLSVTRAEVRERVVVASMTGFP